MRKAFIIFATLLMLVACENNSDPTKESTIGTADLTKREQAILTTTAGKSFVYDFSVDNDYKNVNIFVERYEFGKRVSENPNGVTMSLDDEKKGTIIFSANSLVEHEEQLLFRIGVHTDSTSVVGESVETLPDDKEKELMSGWGSNISDKQSITPNMILGSISYKSDGGNFTSFDNEFSEELLKEYDVVFLLKVNFIK